MTQIMMRSEHLALEKMELVIKDISLNPRTRMFKELTGITKYNVS